MRLVLQCAMCGTHHPVGAAECSTCGATGVAQLRLMFECQTCNRLDLSPVCAACPTPGGALSLTLDLDEALIIAEEIADEPIAVEVGEDGTAYIDADKAAERVRGYSGDSDDDEEDDLDDDEDDLDDDDGDDDLDSDLDDRDEYDLDDEDDEDDEDEDEEDDEDDDEEDDDDY